MFHKSCRMCKHVAYAGGDLGLPKEYYCDAVNPNMPLYGYPVLPFACPENKTEQRKPNRYESFREQTATIDGLVQFCMDNELCHCANRATCVSDASLECCKAGIKAYLEGEIDAE